MKQVGVMQMSFNITL